MGWDVTYLLLLLGRPLLGRCLLLFSRLFGWGAFFLGFLFSILVCSFVVVGDLLCIVAGKMGMWLVLGILSTYLGAGFPGWSLLLGFLLFILTSIFFVLLQPHQHAPIPSQSYNTTHLFLLRRHFLLLGFLFLLVTRYSRLLSGLGYVLRSDFACSPSSFDPILVLFFEVVEAVEVGCRGEGFLHVGDYFFGDAAPVAPCAGGVCVLGCGMEVDIIIRNANAQGGISSKVNNCPKAQCAFLNCSPCENVSPSI
jgi:hypothetical protein